LVNLIYTEVMYIFNLKYLKNSCKLFDTLKEALLKCNIPRQTVESKFSFSARELYQNCIPDM